MNHEAKRRWSEYLSAQADRILIWDHDLGTFVRFMFGRPAQAT